ncbi:MULTISPECIES: DUF6477 family protein [Falsihalocynthiibacter]|jgi:hypothetical protein|uniref:Uncharacterized protein n=1 Tax=Falsihalocynthiibacter arcticus TaxID=1579316 RepID=A0A126V4B9_9RHOB|nr:DUF6477 family protein [Falsihalocynthiibacter arcticus]AML52716.1 hypothetical protein RC74_16895 [Falsihalocynthiibacter arcticus]
MNDILTMLKMLNRPRLLVRAARHGLSEYNRDRHLPRLIKDARLPGPGQAVITLMSEEQILEEKRKLGDASYSVMLHIEMLVALMGEAKLLAVRTA